MAKVRIEEGESLDNALRRFRRDLERTGKLKDARRHERYEKPSDRKRRLAKARRRRTRRRERS